MVLSALGDAARSALAELMVSGRYEYQSDFAKKYFALGQAAATAKFLLKALTARNLQLSPEQNALIAECQDLATLERWIDQALTANNIEEALAQPAKS